MSWREPSDFERRLVADFRAETAGGLSSPLGQLAQRLAPATRIEPLLLRNARLHFLPASDTGIEAQLCFSRLVAARSQRDIVLHAGVSRLLCEELWRDPERFAATLAFLDRHSRHWPPEDRLQQTLRLVTLRPPDASSVPATLHAGLRDMVQLIASETDEPRRTRLARSFRQTLALCDSAALEPFAELGWLRQFSSCRLGTPAQPAGSAQAVSALPVWLNESTAAVAHTFRRARLAIDVYYDRNGQRVDLHLRAGGDNDPAIELPTPLPADLHVAAEGSAGRWHLLQGDHRLSLPIRSASQEFVIHLTTIDGRRHRLQVQLPHDRPPPLPVRLLLTHLEEDHAGAQAFADWLRHAGIGCELRAEAVNAQADVGHDETPATLPVLRLWTPAARRRLPASDDDLALSTSRSALLRLDPAVELPAAGSGVASVLDLSGWRPDQPTDEADVFLRQLAGWLLGGDTSKPTDRHDAALADEAARLLAELDDPQTTPPRRLAIGDRLAEIGDPRPGVGLDARGIPDIDWVEIPGGEFVYQNGERRTLPAFRIARYPVTNAQYQAFIDAGAYRNAEQGKKRRRAKDLSAAGDWWDGLNRPKPEASRWPQANRPRTNVSWYEAVAFTRWLSAQLRYMVRLPTEEEWERAARGDAGREYPWGDAYASGVANVNETSRYGDKPAGPWYLEQTSAVGVYPAGASPEGVLDLAGNVWEWCLNKYERPAEIGSDRSGDARVLRGGSWYIHPVNARAVLRSGRPPGNRHYYWGFRLVSPAPIP